MNAQGVNSDSTIKHRFPWKWWLKDLSSVHQNGLKVFSCFACGGGSSMGYKLAGYTVLGNCEIDPKIAAVYKTNLHPKHSFVMDVRDFLKLPDNEIPEDLFSLDVLDGSPPCSTFSTAGQREDAWGKKKQFAEGQKLQRLDDLFFTFIAIAGRLKPKVVVAENVKGLILGNAKGYVNEIIKGFKEIGYDVQLFLLNAASMGVPQSRERIFFIARRKDLCLLPVKMSFNEPQITFGEVRSEYGKKFTFSGCKYERLLKKRTPQDKCIGDIYKRLNGRMTGFTIAINADNEPAQTVVAERRTYRGCDGLCTTDEDVRNASTFPQDYNFGKKKPYIYLRYERSPCHDGKRSSPSR